MGTSGDKRGLVAIDRLVAIVPLKDVWAEAGQLLIFAIGAGRAKVDAVPIVLAFALLAGVACASCIGYVKHGLS